jgi:hypothetical protein
MSTMGSAAAGGGRRIVDRSGTRGRWGVRLLCYVAAAALGYTRPAAGQAAVPANAAPQGEAAGKACYRGRISPPCRSFWITEFGGAWYTVPPLGQEAPEGREFLFLWELGWMRNRSAHEAVGASVFFATNDEVMRAGVRGRYRRWLGDGLSVDVAPTLIVLQSNRAYEVRARPGVSVLGALDFGDLIVLTGEVEATGGGVRALYGVRMGSYAGAVSGLGLPVLVAALLGDDRS